MGMHAKLLENALEFAPDAMVIVDANGTVVYANRQVAQLFGIDKDDLINQSVDSLLPRRFHEPHGERHRRFAVDSRMRPLGAGLELYGLRADGAEFPVEISLSPLMYGLTAAAIRDVSDHKRAESELIAAREAATLARDAADRANLIKSRFLASASHDLRQPLQALALFNAMLRRMYLESKAQQAVIEQEHALNAMKRLLNALLDIGKLESGAVTPYLADVPLNLMFTELRNEFAAMAADKALSIQMEVTAAWVHTDAALLEQLLRNLISNAIKYTHTGSVNVRAVSEGDFVCIEVSDTGIGMEHDQLTHIFEEFYQIHAAADKARDGYGLGLAIVQRIAKLLGLKLEVASTLGAGSVFTLELPIAREQSRSIEENTVNAAVGAGISGERSRKVLIIEDDERVRAATELFLGLERYSVVTAESGDQAVALAEKNLDVDIVVTDYHLSKTETGMAVLGSVRSRLGRDVPAIVVTGDTSPMISELPHDGHVRFASKPMDADKLLQLMQELLELEERRPI